VDGTNRIKAVELLLVAAFLVVATVAIIVILPKAAPADGTGSAGDPEVISQTASGPLTTADRDFLFKIRQAGLWEIPSGNMAQSKSNNQRVKEVGRILAADHVKLDEQVRALAAQLGVVLPSEPTESQQKWLAEQMAAAPGEEFDKVFANRLRLAHGSVFSTIAFVRAGTRNDQIRAFADVGNTFVLKHMRLLESTGLVDHSQLPQPPAPK
jgi:predicted outer membrane protein